MQKQIVITDEAGLANLAVEILALKPQIIALEGPLGVGKTNFTKKIALLLGIKDTVTSPTFTIHEEYDQFDHIDVWRIEDPEEFTAIGFNKMIANKRLVIIEWAEKVKNKILEHSKNSLIIWIKFKYGTKKNERIIEYENLSN